MTNESKSNQLELPSSESRSYEQEPNHGLTARELEILNLIFSGRPSLEVAKLLCVSKRTIDFHLGKAYAKLGVSNRVQAYKKASELGLIA